jgi:hypothetical protein
MGIAVSFSRSFKGFSWSQIWEILELSELLFHSSAKASDWQLLGQLTAWKSRLGMAAVLENQGLLAVQQGLS